jgi:tellurite resistance-related uncharacterized protein
MAQELPQGLVAYRRTPVFDNGSVPAALKQRHRTKAGVWALIKVLEGRLRFRIPDTGDEQWLTPGRPGVVFPEQVHSVEPDGAVRFFVEFYAPAETVYAAGEEHAS